MRTTMTLLAALSLGACAETMSTQEDAAAMGAADATTATQTAAAPAPAEANNLPTVAARYVEMAGASDQYEIQSSQLALQKAQSAEVRQFAQMMIDQHRMTTEQVTTAARSAGITPPPPQLNATQRDMMAQLQGANGVAFDQAYLQQQRQAHQMALALHRNFAERGDTQALQQVARQAVPIVERHISELQGMGQA